MKALTHQDGDWCGDLNSTIPYLAKLKAKCVESPEPIGPQVREWKEKLPSLIDACMESAAQRERISDLELYDYLRQEHDDERWRELFPGWTLEESPTSYKFRPCFPIWESIQHDQVREAINEYSDGKPAFAGFAVPLSSRPMTCKRTVGPYLAAVVPQRLSMPLSPENQRAGCLAAFGGCRGMGNRSRPGARIWVVPIWSALSRPRRCDEAGSFRLHASRRSRSGASGGYLSL